MLLTIKLKVRTSWLGSERTVNQVRRFERDVHANKLKLDLAQWNWALSQAVDDLRMDHIDVSSIRFPTTLVSPTLELLKRRWSSKSKGHEEEKFESIRTGTHLSLDVFITSSREPAANTGGKESGKSPTASEFQTIMAFIGEHIGLSPWGNRMGYGRFEVLETYATNGNVTNTPASSTSGLGRSGTDNRARATGAAQETDAAGEEIDMRCDDEMAEADEGGADSDIQHAFRIASGNSNLPGYVEDSKGVPGEEGV